MVEEVAKTFLTSANFSWQTVQWSNPDALALWFDLAAMDYAKKTEAEAAATLAAVDATPTTGVAPTLDAWVAAITAAAGGILSATGRYADTVYADVTTGYEILGMVSQRRPDLPGDRGRRPVQRPLSDHRRPAASDLARSFPLRRSSSAIRPRCLRLKRPARPSNCAPSSRQSAAWKSGLSARSWPKSRTRPPSPN